ncbi:MAG TPA: hypothetical protein DEA47_01010 [Peptococcaceae bacterium]|nr:MAG: hypothetical protein XD50_0285 [Clostridia bacterium 41_269]HBT19944.1 hypothetical protein [Peptococcaceae bacterium]
MSDLGIVLTPLFNDRFEILVYPELLNKGISILNRLVKVQFSKDDSSGYVLGKINNFRVESSLAEHPEVARSIAQHEDKEAIKNILKSKTSLILECEVISAFNSEGKRVLLDFPLRPVEKVCFVDEDLKKSLFRSIDFLFSFGKISGTKMPHYVYLADCDVLGEAYHILLAGQSGSGKSTLAKMMLLGYAKNSSEMNIFILDPVGEFTNAFNNQDRGTFKLELGKLWDNINRKRPLLYSLNNIALDTWEIFEELLVRHEVFKNIGVKHSENQKDASEYFIKALKSNGIKLNETVKAINMENGSFLRKILLSEGFLKSVYSDKERRQRVESLINQDDSYKSFLNDYKKVAELFDTSKRKTTIKKLTWSIPNKKGETIVVDLSSLDWTDSVKYLLIKEILNNLYNASLETYKRQKKTNFNTLVVLDEAHRIAPSEKYLENKEYAQKAKKATINAFVETRKFGLGWMVISTRISLLDPKLFEHTRVKILGYGLGTGTDADLLRETFGSDFLRVYNQIPDPTDPLSERRTHTFAVHGPICLLSRNVPEIIDVFSTPQELFEANNINAYADINSQQQEDSADSTDSTEFFEDLPF